MSLKARMSRKKIDFARQMRARPTDAEQVLWEHIRKCQLGKYYRFTRQEPLLGYIVDFWCARANLVVEVDGLIHQDRAEYDARRDAAMRVRGVSVLRFTNEEVLGDLPCVLRKLTDALNTARVDSHSQRIEKGEYILVNGVRVWDLDHQFLRTQRSPSFDPSLYCIRIVIESGVERHCLEALPGTAEKLGIIYGP